MGAHALQRLARMGIDFVYTFPNERSRPSFERNHKYVKVARVPIYVTPLEPGRLLGPRIGIRPSARNA